MSTTTASTGAGSSANAGSLRSILHLKKSTASSSNSGAASASRVTLPGSGASTNSGAALKIILRSHVVTGQSLNSSVVRSIIHLGKATGQSLNSGFASAGISEAPCNITVADYLERLGKLLDDPGHVYYTRAEIVHCLNIAQRLFCFLALAIERTATFNLTNGQNFYTITDQLADFLAPLRVSHSGTRLKSDTLHQMNLRDSLWRARAGNPVRYAQQGLNKLWITPQPASGVHTLSFTYAAEPADLVNDTDAPSIPGDQQATLEDFAFYFLRLKEGSQEMVNAGQYLKRALDQTTKYASFVRAKNRAQGYDRFPFDLESFDRSKFEIKLKRQMDAMKKQKKDQQQ